MARWIVSATALLAAVLLLRAALGRRMGPQLRYLLWLPVLLRLLLPFSVGQSAASPANLVRPTGELSAVLIPTAQGTPEALDVTVLPDGGLLDANSAGWAVPEEDGTVSRFLLRADWTTALRTVWLAGMAVTAAWFCLCNGLFARQLRRSRTLLEAGRPPVYRADVPSPCVFGALRPAIYLNPRADGDPTARAHALLHERTHLRHGDHLWALLRTVCLVLWWYHPLVWLAARLSRQDGELCCDDSVLRQLPPEERTAYGRTLLTLAAGGRTTAFCAASTLSRSGRQLKARISAIARGARPRVWAAALAAVLVLAAMGCAFAGAETAPEAPADLAETEPDAVGSPGTAAEADPAGTPAEDPAESSRAAIVAAFGRTPPEEDAVLLAADAAADRSAGLLGAVLYTRPGDGTSFHIAFLLDDAPPFFYPVGIADDSDPLTPQPETFRFSGSDAAVVTVVDGDEQTLEYRLTCTVSDDGAVGSVHFTAETTRRGSVSKNSRERLF